MATDVTGTVDEKDGALVVKGADGAAVRWVKESDLLAVKGGKESFEKEAKSAKEAHATAVAEATTKLEAERQKALGAEARAASLEEKLHAHEGSAAELARVKADLEAAKKSSETQGSRYLDLRKAVLVSTYGIPKATVEKKTLAELDVYEDVLKSVIGDKAAGNFAVGGGTGGANPLANRKPMDLAVDAYSRSNK